MTLTKRQREILEALRRGNRIQWNMTGMLFENRRLHDATFEALVATGELARVRLRGKYSARMTLDYLCHRDKVQEVAGGREILEQVVPFTGFGKHGKGGE
jgi:hypothetical protein